jgi:hypothetical protein
VGGTQYQKVGCRDDIDRRAWSRPLLQAVTIYRWHFGPFNLLQTDGVRIHYIGSTCDSFEVFFLCRGGSYKEAKSKDQPLDFPKIF